MIRDSCERCDDEAHNARRLLDEDLVSLETQLLIGYQVAVGFITNGSLHHQVVDTPCCGQLEHMLFCRLRNTITVDIHSTKPQHRLAVDLEA
jgi:hypothetical protein